MSPELETAVRERVDLGHSQEQIAAELRQAGYDDATITQVYATVMGGGATAPTTAIPSGALIGYRALVSESFKLAWAQKGLFAAAFFYAIATAIVGSLLAMVLIPATAGSVAAGVALGFFGILLLAVVFVGIMAALQRALLDRANAQPLRAYTGWAVRTVPGLILVSLYIQFATSSGYLLLVIPGIALSIYTAFAFLVRVSDEATGVRALVRSTEIIYDRWWSTVGRLLFSSIVFFLAMLVPFIVVVILWGLANLAGAGAGFFTDVLVPILMALVFVVWIFGLIALTHSAGVLLFESLRSTARPFTPEGSKKLYFWMRVAVIVGLPIAILWNGLSLYSDLQQISAVPELGVTGLESAQFETDLTPEEQAEFEAFMEEFGVELDDVEVESR